MSTQQKDPTRIKTTTEIKLPGPLALRFNSVQVAPRARKPRQLLALLLLNIEHFVPASYLLHGLWDDSPPVSAVTTLQTYILQLRNSLGELDGMAARDVLVTMDGGYM